MAPANTILLRLAPATANPPPAAGMTTTILDMDTLIQNRTNGKVTIQPYWAQSLVPGNQIITALQNDVADIGVISPHQEPGKVPLSMVSQLPGIGTDMWARATAFWDLCNQDPEKSELGKYNIKPVAIFLTTDQRVLSKMPIRTLADIKGKKLAASGVAADIISALGAVPIAMAPPDEYTGMQKGTIDGIMAPLSAVVDFKFFEVGKYFTYINCGCRLYPVAINQDVWNKFPADVQKVFTDSVPDFINITYKDTVTIDDNAAIKVMQDNNVEAIQLNNADNAALQQITGTYADTWAAKQGANGQKILSDYRALVAKYEAISPYKK